MQVELLMCIHIYVESRYVRMHVDDERLKAWQLARPRGRRRWGGFMHTIHVYVCSLHGLEYGAHRRPNLADFLLPLRAWRLAFSLSRTRKPRMGNGTLGMCILRKLLHVWERGRSDCGFHGIMHAARRLVYEEAGAWERLETLSKLSFIKLPGFLFCFCNDLSPLSWAYARMSSNWAWKLNACALKNEWKSLDSNLRKLTGTSLVRETHHVVLCIWN